MKHLRRYAEKMGQDIAACELAEETLSQDGNLKSELVEFEAIHYAQTTL